MKLLVFSLFLLVVVGCASENKWIKKHAVSRKVTLLSCDNGSVIKEWKCQCRINTQEGIASWVNDDGYRLWIAGCFVIEEI